MSPPKKQPDPAAVAPRRIADGAARALRDSMGEPDDSFAIGVEAHRNADALVRERDLGVSLHDSERLVRFPKHLQELFAEMGKPEARVISALMALEPDEVAALIRIAQREAERTTIAIWRSRIVKAAVGLAVTFFAVAKWGADQVPLIKEIVSFLKGHGS